MSILICFIQVGVILMMSYFNCEHLSQNTADQSSELTHLCHQHSNSMGANFSLIEQAQENIEF